MFHREFKGKNCVSQHNITCGDEIHFKSGEEFILTGNIKLSINGKIGRVIVELGILPSKQKHDPQAEIFVDVHDVVVYS
jgi:hypothetical protein